MTLFNFKNVKILTKHNDESILIGVDFNTVRNPSLDKPIRNCNNH